MKARKHASKKVFNVVILFVVVLTLLCAIHKTLSNGLHIQNLKIGKLNISELYLKLDNKLSLNIDSIDLSSLLKKRPNSHKHLDVSDLIKGIRYGIWAVSYFEKFKIKEIVLDAQNKARVFFDGHKYELEFPGIKGEFSLEDNKNIKLKIINLLFKDMKVQVDGNAHYSPKAKKMAFNFMIKPLDEPSATLYLQGLTDLKTIELKANTSKMKSIAFLKPLFQKQSQKKLKTWIFDKIQFAGLKIDSALIRANLAKGKLLPSLLENSRIKATLTDTSVVFNDGLSPIKINKAELLLQNKQLLIEPQKITYETMDLSGSSAVLSNMLEASRLEIFLRNTPNYYGDTIKDLLSAYKIALPLDKISTPSSANLKLTLQFLKNTAPLFSIQGNIELQEGGFMLYHVPLYTQSANIDLDITPEYQYIYIDTIHTRYENMLDLDTKIALDIHKKKLALDSKVHKIQLNTNNNINMRSYSLSNAEDEILPSFALDLKSLHTIIQAGEHSEVFRRKIIDTIKAQSEDKFSKNVFYATQDSLKSLSFNFDFSNPNHIQWSVPELLLEGELKNSVYFFRIKDLKKIKPYSPIMNYFTLEDGSLEVSTSNFLNIDFLAKDLKVDLPAYYADGTHINTLSLLGSINKDEIHVYTPDKNVSVVIKGDNKNIAINNIDFNIDEFLDSKMPAIVKMLSKERREKPTQKEIHDEDIFIAAKQRYEKARKIIPIATHIQAKDVVLVYKKMPIPLENLDIVAQDNRVKVDGNYKNGMIFADLVHGALYLKAHNFSGDFINSVLQKDFVDGGLYTLIGAFKDQVFNGELKVQNTSLKNFALMQNMVNLINTIPSLIVFKNPHWGANGYDIKKGSIVFGVTKQYLGLEQINIIGKTLDIAGNGIIELDRNKLDLSLEISTIKALSNVISNIPIVGYLILGKNGKISTNVSVKGTLDNPTTKITLAKDIAQAPLKILRRIFTPIDVIVGEIKKNIREKERK
ncbi:AsmA-like C-terminal domain-containing protein [Helicobacter cetorum]|uniref:YhdP family protein n=1 Tax=Helicobacter cetorum TaxID=138563 RepID=UPI000CF08AA4|nr:AsmA-like C-terminal domain-containing protein [Helicobacter cetorum]